MTELAAQRPRAGFPARGTQAPGTFRPPTAVRTSLPPPDQQPPERAKPLPYSLTRTHQASPHRVAGA